MSIQPGVGRAAIDRIETEITELFARYEAYLHTPTADPQVSSDLGKHACVRLCGYLERSLTILSENHVQRFGGHVTVRQFAASWLERSPNPKRGAILTFAERFDEGWPKELETVLDKVDPEKTLDSFVQTRNQIAHGGTASIGIAALQNYLTIVIAVVHWMKDKFDPLPVKVTTT